MHLASMLHTCPQPITRVHRWAAMDGYFVRAKTHQHGLAIYLCPGLQVIWMLAKF